MESVGRASPRGARSLLAVPGPGPPDADDEDGEVVVGGIRPKSSPLPRRRSSASDDDSEPEAPASGSRRVSFADAKGLSLVHVKEFEMWEVPNLPRHELCESEGQDADQYNLSFLNFSLLSDGELLIKVQDHKVVLESLELLPATTILKGVVRVLNVSFSKAVFVRASLDAWCSHFDLLAEYTPGSSDGHMDRFSFKLTLVPPCGEQGTRVDFCLRYETPAGTFWANNDGGNYVLLCHREMREKRRENVNKRSCLKPVSQNLPEENCSAAGASSQGNVSPAASKPLEELSPVRDTRVSDGRVAALREDERRLRAENRRDGGPRGQQTAALHFGGRVAQSDGGADDAGGDGPADERLETQPFVDESAAACGEALGDVRHETSRAHESARAPEKPEDNSLAAAGGGESAARVPDEPEDSNQQPPADLHNVKQPAEAEGDDHMIHERLSNVEPEAGDTGSERQNSVTSGAADVKAPLCHQVFARVESEGQRAALANEDIAPTTESCSIAAQENECLPVTLNDSPTEGEDECLSVWSDPADALQHPVEVIHSHHRCTASYEVTGPVYRDAATHPHTGNVLNMESVNVQAPEESLCPQGEAQEDNVTFDLHWQAIAAAAQAELTEPCAQIQTDLNASTAQTERHKVVTSVGKDEIGVKNNFTTRATSLEAQAETHDAAERGNLESCVFEDEIIHPADSEVGAEVAGSMTKADHTRGDTFVQFKDKPIIVTEHIQHWEMKAAVAAVEELSPAQPADWETTGLVEEKEENVLTDEEKTETTGSKSEDAEAVGRLEDTAVEKEVEKAQTGGKAEEREAEDADALEDQQNAEEEENRKIMARTHGNAEATQIKTIIGENEPTEGCVTEKRGDKRTNVQNEEETEPEKQTEIELRGEAQAAARWEDGVKPEDHTEHNHLDYVGEVLVAEGRGAEADPRGVTSASAEDGAGRRRERWAITQNEVAAGSSALLSNTPGEDQEDPGGDASAESDSDDEVELYMRCLRAVHAGPAPARGDRGRGPSAGRSRSRSTHMPPISEALDEEQPLSCLLCEDAERLRVRAAAAAAPGARQRVQKHVSCWKEACSCSSISKALLYASSLVVFLVVAYHYDFLACFALYLASVAWLCCQGDTRTRG